MKHTAVAPFGAIFRSSRPACGTVLGAGGAFATATAGGATGPGVGTITGGAMAAGKTCSGAAGAFAKAFAAGFGTEEAFASSSQYEKGLIEKMSDPQWLRRPQNFAFAQNKFTTNRFLH